MGDQEPAARRKRGQEEHEAVHRLSELLDVDRRWVRALCRSGVRGLDDMTAWTVQDLGYVSGIGALGVSVLAPRLRAVGVPLPDVPVVSWRGPGRPPAAPRQAGGVDLTYALDADTGEAHILSWQRAVRVSRRFALCGIRGHGLQVLTVRPDVRVVCEPCVLVLGAAITRGR